MTIYDTQLLRLNKHKGKAEYVRLLEYFEKHQFALEPFMDSVEPEVYRNFQHYLIEIKGYTLKEAESYYNEAHELYKAMITASKKTPELQNCPNQKCNKDLSDMDVLYPPLETDYGIAWRDVECPSCGAGWREEYEYIGHYTTGG